MGLAAQACTPHEQLHALHVYATLPTIHLLPNRRRVSAQAAYNYFYEMVIMTCKHDIAYLVRNACNANARAHAGGDRATTVQPTRVYFGTQQIHARRETRARFGPQQRRGRCLA